MYDVAVLGAGPSGLATALRLQKMGRSVVVLGRTPSAHNSIGELLSPGICRIMEFLGLPDILSQSHGYEVNNQLAIWDEQEARVIPSRPDHAGIMVDRALFDEQLCQAAQEAGVAVMRPAHVESMCRSSEGWRISFTKQGQRELETRFVVDARGRSGIAKTRVALAPRLLALHEEFSPPSTARELRVEAISSGWLWGAPTCRGTYRVIGFCDPAVMRRLHASSSPGNPSAWLHAMLSETQLFEQFASESSLTCEAFDATPYIDGQWWGEYALKVGDAALALDPLSSSGVEKGMRFAMQAALAINTILADANAHGVAKAFMQGKIEETCGRHMAWTQQRYEAAWCAQGHHFWTSRSAERTLAPFNDAGAQRIYEYREMAWSILEDLAPAHDRVLDPLRLLNVPALAADVAIVEVASAVGNVIALRPAVTHPGLATPVVFVYGRELVPLLRKVSGARSYTHLVERWAARLPIAEAVAICAWALQIGLLVDGPTPD